jgi:hypothetical protein
MEIDMVQLQMMNSPINKKANSIKEAEDTAGKMSNWFLSHIFNEMMNDMGDDTFGGEDAKLYTSYLMPMLFQEHNDPRFGFADQLKHEMYRLNGVEETVKREIAPCA